MMLYVISWYRWYLDHLEQPNIWCLNTIVASEIGFLLHIPWTVKGNPMTYPNSHWKSILRKTHLFPYIWCKHKMSVNDIHLRFLKVANYNDSPACVNTHWSFNFGPCTSKCCEPCNLPASCLKCLCCSSILHHMAEQIYDRHFFKSVTVHNFKSLCCL